MNRIENKFAELKAAGKKALITFLTSGDPDIETTEKAVLEMFDKGADIIELGVPFSDPVAEGPVIQEASLRSLNGGTNLDKIFGAVENIRKATDKPLVLMMYINTVFRYGTAKFFEKCRLTGIDGVIIPDMPYEEKAEMEEPANAHNVAVISMIAPTSEEKIKMIAGEAKGFIYVVSSMGVTGVRSEIKTDLGSIVESIRAVTDVPCAIGFGISTPEQAKAMAAVSDGAIVGSAIVKIVEKYGRESPKYVYEYCKEMVEAVNKAADEL